MKLVSRINLEFSWTDAVHLPTIDNTNAILAFFTDRSDMHFCTDA